MKKSKIAPRGFRISAQPVVESHPVVEPTSAEIPAGLGELPSSYGTDLLYVIARDLKSLFLYWDLNWPQAFATAGMSAREIHLRVFRADGSIEATTAIDPAVGQCFAEVSAPGTEYYCELGCFDGDEWKYLVRSATTTTPEGEMSEDFSAVFATLPIHLSFQRLIENFEKTTPNESGHEFKAVGDASDLALRVATTEDRDSQSSEMLEQWKQLGERYGGSSCGDLSSSGFGRSSRA